MGVRCGELPRHRDPKREQAKQIWLDGQGEIKLKDIASQLGITDGQIRKWKSLDKWETDAKSNVPNPNSNVPKRSGAPKGNTNAIGNISGGPVGNKKAVTTGERETISWDMLDDDERLIYTTINTDELVAIDRTIRMMEIRERRMLKRIKELQDGANMVMSAAVETNQSSKQFGDSDGRTTTLESSVDRIQRIEEALTRVQEKKGKYIELRSKLIPPEMRVEMEKLRMEKLRAEVAKMQREEEELLEDEAGSLDSFIRAIEASGNDAGDADV